MYYRGKVLKRIEINERECIDIIFRKDGAFQFIHRKPCDDKAPAPTQFESTSYITADAAEAAARKKFGMGD